MLNLALSLIDGGAIEILVTDEQVTMLRSETVDGVLGWRDFAGITTDDWGPPPVYGQITGTLDGEQIDYRFGIGKKPRPGRRR